MALNRSSTEGKNEIYLMIGAAYRSLGQHAQAYRYFKKAVHPFSSDTTLEHLYWLASSALLAGRFSEGALLLRCFAQKVPPDDATWYERLKELERSAVLVGQR